MVRGTLAARLREHVNPERLQVFYEKLVSRRRLNHHLAGYVGRCVSRAPSAILGRRASRRTRATTVLTDRSRRVSRRYLLRAGTSSGATRQPDAVTERECGSVSQRPRKRARRLTVPAGAPTGVPAVRQTHTQPAAAAAAASRPPVASDGVASTATVAAATRQRSGTATQAPLRSTQVRGAAGTCSHGRATQRRR